MLTIPTLAEPITKPGMFAYEHFVPSRSRGSRAVPGPRDTFGFLSRARWYAMLDDLNAMFYATVYVGISLSVYHH
jgi:hypothetical protein